MLGRASSLGTKGFRFAGLDRAGDQCTILECPAMPREVRPERSGIAHKVRFPPHPRRRIGVRNMEVLDGAPIQEGYPCGLKAADF